MSELTDLPERPQEGGAPLATPSPVAAPAMAGTDAASAPVESRARRRAVSLQDGVATLRGALRTMPGTPGVYRMLGVDGAALYVGKARNLKRRVAQYTQVQRLPARLQRMVAETASVEVVQTHTEVEALLLETNLIKKLRPRFNVLMRDDKSFAHIFVPSDHPFPKATKFRGAQTRPGDYFGPFASTWAVNRSLTALQRAFLLRSCSDGEFSRRSRPCMQYQIRRCTAPCVGLVSPEDYAAQVADARAFLSGRSRQIQEGFAARMQAAAEALDYEAAARFRDRIRALTSVQSNQDINLPGIGDVDLFAAHQEGGQTCIQVFFFRGDQNNGNRPYFPQHDRKVEVAEVLTAFVAQFYAERTPPRLVLLSHPVEEAELLAEALCLRAGHKVELAVPQRGDKRRAMEHALHNAKEALARRLAETATQATLLAGVAETFGLPGPPRRIEIYDNSHTGGQNAIGAMVVAGPEGFVKGAYRKFNIRTDLAPGDDYGMMREVLGRRFARQRREAPDRSDPSWPDLVLIDGGRGQLAAASQVMSELDLADLPLVAIAKGADRDAGREQFFLAGREPFLLEPRSPVLYYLQRLRDEAHRFAIGTMRARRQKAIGQTGLDEVIGIGPARKRALLTHFGSARAVARAGLADLEAVAGVSKAVARRIYDHFHGA